MWRGNLDAIVAAHQDAILGPSELGDADGEPDADRQQGDGKSEGGDVGQHSLPIVAGIFTVAFIAREIVGDFELVDKRRKIAALGQRGSRTRPELEHAMLFFGRGCDDGLLGSHGCRLRGN